MRPYRVIFFYYLLVPSLSISAGLTNRTIDDTYGDLVTNVLVEYTHNWNSQPGCAGCKVQPDSSRAYSGTWHDTTTNAPNTTEPHSATLKFNGTPYLLPSSVACLS